MPAERTQPRPVDLGPDPARGDDGVASSRGGRGSVMVSHGVHSHSQPLAGMSVRRARSELAERMNIAPNAAAIIDGNPVDEDTVIQEGQSLMFIAPSGEKGGCEERRTRSERQES